MPDLLIVTLASALAGCLDAIVGGGGLVLVPALFSVYPGAAPATLFGTNKGAAVWGTAWAARLYARRVCLRWASLLPAMAMALIGAACGAWTVSLVDPRSLRRALPLLLLALLAYTLWRRDLGQQHAPRHAGWAEAWRAAAIGGGIGFYDGLFGPGTGSFFVFLYVRVLGLDFLNASAHAKLLNATTNVAALGLFVSQGHIWWQVAGCLAVANVLGSMVGTRLALRHGSGFVRRVFVVVVGALVLRTGWDALQI